MSDAKTFSTVSLVFKDGLTPQSKQFKPIRMLLEKYDVDAELYVGDDSTLVFDLVAVDYDTIRDLFVELIEHLHVDRRSQATVFEDDHVKCITVIDSELQEAS